MTDFDSLSGDELNLRIAELRGWEHRATVPGGMFIWDDGYRHYDNLPNIAGNNCVALEAAEWMKERGWNYVIEQDNQKYQVAFWKQEKYSDLYFVSNEESKLSLAVARAMVKALESEAK